MEETAQNINSFHLAGVIPVAGQPLDFNFPWHDCLQPIAQNYLAVERSVVECAYAGCETIWIVCHDDMQPLIRHRLGEYVQDPSYLSNNFVQNSSDYKRIIPIFYVPIHPKDRDKRDCLSWSVLYGASRADWTSRQISKWVAPDKYYVSFPYGAYMPEIVKPFRKTISSKKQFFLSHGKKTVRDGEYLGFTFDNKNFKNLLKRVRKEGTGMKAPNQNQEGIPTKVLPIEKRWSARFFSLKKVFQFVMMENVEIFEVPWYYNISSWEGLCKYLGSSKQKEIRRPSKHLLAYHEFSRVGVDNDER
tara:strand:- start:1831 stop:2739 length:909 start_codon:yes stop_codon:yes gene_type:complete